MGDEAVRDAATKKDLASAGSAFVYELRDVSVGYDDRGPVLAHVNAEFEAGRVHVIQGPSGAGKTTLLNLLMGLVLPLAGEVVGLCPAACLQPVRELKPAVCPQPARDLQPTARLRPARGPQPARVTRPRLAAVFQEDRLCDGLTATANIRLPHAHLRGADLDAFLDRSHDALAAVGLPEAAADPRPVRELSGGQRRRVAILRALLADADVLFFDEPLRGMDAATIDALMAYALPLLAGKTVFWVTHAPSEAGYFSDCVQWRVENSSLLPVTPAK